MCVCVFVFGCVCVCSSTCVFWAEMAIKIAIFTESRRFCDIGNETPMPETHPAKLKALQIVNHYGDSTMGNEIASKLIFKRSNSVTVMDN